MKMRIKFEPDSGRDALNGCEGEAWPHAEI
jgi:hypothetical protein